MPDSDLAAILARESMAGCSRAALHVLAEKWPAYNHRKRAHLLTAIRNGAWLEGRTMVKLDREEAGGDPAVFRFTNPETRAEHFVRVFTFRPARSYADPHPEPFVVATCSDECPSFGYVGFCRHCEHTCRLCEATIRDIERAARMEEAFV